MDRHFKIANNPEGFGQVRLFTNVPYSEAHPELTLQLLRPLWKSDGKGFPCVVFIQGSGWTKPDMFAQMPMLSRLASEGYVIASVTHRSCFEAAAPAFLQDVKSAIRFLRANAEKYDIDTERLGCWGTSSGGNTALLLGMTGDDPTFRTEAYAEVSDAVKLVVDCFGPSDIMGLVNYFKDSPEADNPDNVIVALCGDPRKTGTALADLISPLRYVKPGLRLPPFLILNGNADPIVPFKQSSDMHEALLSCGYESTLVEVEGAPHEGNFWGTVLRETIFNFIRERL